MEHSLVSGWLPLLLPGQNSKEYSTIENELVNKHSVSKNLNHIFCYRFNGYCFEYKISSDCAPPLALFAECTGVRLFASLWDSNDAEVVKNKHSNPLQHLG